MSVVVWDMETGENVEFFDTVEEAMNFIKSSNNTNLRITSCN